MLPTSSGLKVSTFDGVILLHKINSAQINIGISVSDSKSLCAWAYSLRWYQTLLIKLLWPFPQLLFIWMAPSFCI